MSIAEEVAAAVGKSLGPIVENAVSRALIGLKETLRDEIIHKLSSKEIIIKLPDLTKDA